MLNWRFFRLHIFHYIPHQFKDEKEREREWERTKNTQKAKESLEIYKWENYTRILAKLHKNKWKRERERPN